MVTETTYRQCTLTKPIPSTDEVQAYSTRTVWIPSCFAVAGKVLQLGDDDGWMVFYAGKWKMSQKFVMQRRDDYRYQRRVSDV